MTIQSVEKKRKNANPRSELFTCIISEVMKWKDFNGNENRQSCLKQEENNHKGIVRIEIRTLSRTN